ncbi:MAG: MFS transporter [Desulfobaccales bacterium]
MSQEMNRDKKDKNQAAYAVASGVIGYVLDAMNLQFLAASLPVLIVAFGINKIVAGELAMWQLIGIGLGGVVAGFVADRIGRVKTLTYTIYIFALGSGAIALSHNVIQFTIIRIIASLALGGEWAVGAVLMAEYLPTRKRGIGSGVVQCGWPIGIILASSLAGFILPVYGWRWLFLVGIVPVFPAYWIRHSVKEPETWQRERQKKSTWQEDMKAIVQRGNLRMFVLWSFSIFFLQCAFWGFTIWLPTYFATEKHYGIVKAQVFMIALSLGQILGNLTAGWLADKWRKKPIYVIGAVCSALGLPLLIHFNTASNVFLLTFLYGIFKQVPFALNAAYMSESFPTNIRATAVGTSFNLGRGFSSLAPLMIGIVASKYSIGGGIMLMSVFWAMLAILVGGFIPEYAHLKDEIPEEALIVEKVEPVL